MTEFRIIKDINFETDIAYYPMVNTGWWIFKKWRRIAKHSGGNYGLYNDLGYPKTLEECRSIIQNYYLYRKPRIHIAETIIL